MDCPSYRNFRSYLPPVLFPQNQPRAQVSLKFTFSSWNRTFPASSKTTNQKREKAMNKLLSVGFGGLLAAVMTLATVAESQAQGFSIRFGYSSGYSRGYGGPGFYGGRGYGPPRVAGYPPVYPRYGRRSCVRPVVVPQYHHHHYGPRRNVHFQGGFYGPRRGPHGRFHH